MANKNVRDGDFLRDKRGLVYASLGSEKDKCYAVIVKCGHCGRGFYIPIMFTTKANCVANAIEEIKMAPRVKREKQDCVIDAFEITELEKFIIDAINDHDPYLKGYLETESELMQKRRIASRWSDERDVKTADQYYEYDVLARSFAPRWNGSKLIVPSRINRSELLQEHFRCATLRHSYSVEKDPFFMLLYYMQYGEENDLGIKLNSNKLSFRGYGKSGEFFLDEKFMKYLDRFEIKKSEEKKEEYYSGRIVSKTSQIDKFQARMDRFRKHSQSEQSEKDAQTSSGSQPGE